MFKRLSFVGLMAAAVAVPYVITSSPDLVHSLIGGGKTEKANDNSKSPNHPAGTALAAAATGQPSAITLKPASKPIEGGNVNDLAEVLQFEGTPGWVMSRW